MGRDLENRRRDEMRTVETMVRIYCRGNHRDRLARRDDAPCAECRELIDYAWQRIDACPHMETKTFCSACETHCYKPQMLARIRVAMAYAGPRMIFVDPVGALKHLITMRRAERR